MAMDEAKQEDELASALVSEARDLLQRLPTYEAADLLAALRDGSTAIAAQMRAGAVPGQPGQPAHGQPATLPTADPGSPRSHAPRGALEPIQNAPIVVFGGEVAFDKAVKPDPESRMKLSQRDRLEWESMKPTRRALYRVMNLTREIRRTLGKLPWEPLQKPSKEDITTFILKTNGGYGKVDRDDLKFEVTSKPRGGCWCGSFHWHGDALGAKVREPAHYLIASSSAGTLNLNLIKHFMVRKWNLYQPKILISVTGGAGALDLNSEEKEKIFKGMMEGTRGLSPWFFTGGTDRGVMKYVGEARARYNPDAPLIGVAVLGVVKGGSVLKARTERSLAEGDEEGDSTTGNYADISKDCDHFSASAAPPGLDCNHSHFILVDSAKPASQNPKYFEEFGKEIALRANLESNVAYRFPPFNHYDMTIRPYESGWTARQQEEHLVESMLEMKMGWHGVRMKKPNSKSDFSGANIVSICIQGGVGSVSTIFDAVKHGTPALLVKGSGQAADLIADAALLRYGPDHEMYVQPALFDVNQQHMYAFFELCGLKADSDGFGASDLVDDPDSQEHQCFKYSGMIDLLSKIRQCNQDLEDIAELDRAIRDLEMRSTQSSLLQVKEWILKYAKRARSMERNFYNQTPKERENFTPVLNATEIKMIRALCDREGLFCNINSDEHLPLNLQTTSIIVQGRPGYPVDCEEPMQDESCQDDGRLKRDPFRRSYSRLYEGQGDLVEKGSNVTEAARNLLKRYGLPQNGAVETILKVLTAVAENKCWVYELYPINQNAPDFKACLLNCLVNGFGHPAIDDQETLGKKLSCALKWQNIEVMKDILNKTCLRLPQERRNVLETAMIEAIARNQVAAVQVLYEMGATFDQFGVPTVYPSEEVHEMMQLVRDSSMHMMGTRSHSGESAPKRSRSCWGSLFKIANEDSHVEHAKELLADQKESLEEANKITEMSQGVFSAKNFLQMSFPSGHTKSFDRRLTLKRLGDILEPVGELQRTQLYQILTAQSMLVKQHRNETVVNSKRPKGGHDDEGFEMLRDMKSCRKLLILQALYSTMLGDSFRYKFGIQKAEFDLFLWNVLLDRREMATLLWVHCEFPVRSAITAACLLRKMAKSNAVGLMARESMRRNAEHFEDLAIGVQKQALQDDRTFAQLTMDLPLIVWRGMSLLDLVMEAECHRFLEHCCKEAMDDLETGDLSPHGDGWIDVKIILNILTGGLAIVVFPDMFNFSPPPRSEFARASTQRRRCPPGFPFNPEENEILKDFYKKYKASRPEEDDPSRQNSKTSVLVSGLKQMEMIGQNMKNLGARRCRGQIEPEPAPMTRLPTPKPIPPTNSSTAKSFEHIVNATKEEGVEDQNTVFSRLLEAAAKVRVDMNSIMDSKTKKAMRWMHKLDTDPHFKLKMSDAQLNQLWEPTLTKLERWRLFWRVPRVLYYSNAVIQMLITVLFMYQHLYLNYPNVRPAEQGFVSENIENIILVYCVSCLLREAIEFSIAGFSFLAIITSFWTVVDILQLLFFLYGMALRNNEPGFPKWEKSNAHDPEGSILGIEYANHFSGVTWWKFHYGISLFFLCLKLLRILTTVNHDLCLLVIVFHRMLHDILYWGCVYLTISLAFGVALVSCGDVRGVQDNCHVTGVNLTMVKPEGDVLPSAPAESYLYYECLPFWWLLRSVWAGFGQIALEEMTNTLAIFVALIAFVILNVVLVNLLIALMSGTYQRIRDQSRGQSMIEQYSRIKEFSRTCLGAPPFFNLIVISWDLVNFARIYPSMKERFVGCSFTKLLDIYISRSGSIHNVPEVSADDFRNLETCKAYMQRAQARFLEVESGENQINLVRRQLETTEHHLTSRLEHLIDTMERKFTSVEHSISQAHRENANMPSQGCHAPHDHSSVSVYALRLGFASANARHLLCL